MCLGRGVKAKVAQRILLAAACANNGSLPDENVYLGGAAIRAAGIWKRNARA
jgi:hypothetical protein